MRLRPIPVVATLMVLAARAFDTPSWLPRR